MLRIGRLIAFVAAVLLGMALGQPALATVGVPDIECCSVAPSGARLFEDPANRAVAEYLEGLGQSVRPNPLEGVVGAGRQGDAIVCGVLHEFKSLQPGATSNTIRNSVNNSIRRGGQARNIVIDARGSGLSEADAIAGLVRLPGISRDRLDYVSAIGDDYFRGIGFGS